MTQIMAWMAMGCATVDQAPPELAVEGGGDEPVSAVAFRITAVDAVPGLARLEVRIDGGDPQEIEVPPAGEVDWSPEGLQDGRHTFVFTAVDASWYANATEVEQVATLDTAPPQIEVAPASLEAAQGRTWALWVRADEPMVAVQARGAWLGHDGEVHEEVWPLFPVDGAWRGLRGMEIKQEPGPVSVVIEGEDALGHKGEVSVEVQVKETEFEEGGYIRLTRRQKRARKDTEAIERMRVERNTAYARVFPEAAWAGPFRIPVDDADVTSPFGKYRTYSDGRKSHHSGLDLDQRRGAPILAAAAGEVLVAGEQAIFGNVVIVNHGHRVATSYNHLQSVSVSVGDRVKAGDPVGTLGSTGQSTGPHLHWGLEVGVVAVDPSEWLETGFEKAPFGAP